jgi:hypothetical protein
MMVPKDFLLYVIEPTLVWMSDKIPVKTPYSTPAAAMTLLAIALQETNLDHRAQLGNGPARSFYQFEQDGLTGLLLSDEAGPVAYHMTSLLGYKWDFEYLHKAIEFADNLATVYARLLLHADSRPLSEDKNAMWDLYYDNWRPGKPSRERWDESWGTALNAYLGYAVA